MTRSCCLCHRLGDRTHPSDSVPPGAAHSINLAEAVMQQHVGCSWRGGRGVVAYNAIESKGTFDHIILKPSIEEFGGALGEQVQEHTLVMEIESDNGAGNTSAF